MALVVCWDILPRKWNEVCFLGGDKANLNPPESVFLFDQQCSPSGAPKALASSQETWSERQEGGKTIPGCGS